jgi:predicted dehydrogenase
MLSPFPLITRNRERSLLIFSKLVKHVFMEKPMAVSVLQGEKILNAANKGDARLMVAFMKRFDPGNVLARTTIRQWLRDGTKGRLLYARNHGFQGNWLNGLSQAEPFTNAGTRSRDETTESTLS